MPSLIETRPFTVHPETFAWPSFRLFSLRLVWIYPVVAAGMTFLLWQGLQVSVTLGALISIGITLALLGMSFARHKAFLMKPQNRAAFCNSIVSVDENQVRQDYPDGAFLAIELGSVKSFKEIADFYFVIASPRHAIAVPKTAFESPEDSREFAARIRNAVAHK